MAVHVFDAEDSDGDSWMEVVEGSPGPSMQNSSASLAYGTDEKVESTRKTASWLVDDTWVSDFEDHKEIQGNHDSENNVKVTNVQTEPLPENDRTKDKTQVVIDPHHIANTTNTQFNQTLHIDRPEVGDIKRHFNEVQTLATSQPRKGLYYRLWLCWMYRMEWSQIEHTIQHAPDYIIQIVNYWFGLRNHPFWTAREKCPYHWYSMYRACLAVWTWWDREGTDARNASDQTIIQGSLRNVAFDQKHQTIEPSSASRVETRYSTLYRRTVGRNSIQPDSLTTPKAHEYMSKPPCQIGDNFSFVVCTYKSFGSPSLDRAARGAIPFQTWIHWIHQVNLQPSSKEWAGHDLWPSGDSILPPFAHDLPRSSSALKHVGDVAYEYVKDIGLPYQAAAYYQSVSYM